MTTVRDAFLAGYYAGNQLDRGADFAAEAFIEWQAKQPAQSTTDLYNALEAVLVAKGASPAWLRYALPDLHDAAMTFGNAQYTRGYQARIDGEGCGAFDPPHVGDGVVRAAPVGTDAYTSGFAAGFKAARDDDTDENWRLHIDDHRGVIADADVLGFVKNVVEDEDPSGALLG